MTAYEYKVIPAPRRGTKAKGVKTTEERFALALQEVMNPLGANGWEYLRTDTLPCEERVGLTGRRTEFQNMLVFRRALTETISTQPVTPALVAIPAPTPVAVQIVAPVHAPAPALRAEPRVTETLARDRQEPALTAEAKPDSSDRDPRVAAE